MNRLCFTWRWLISAIILGTALKPVRAEPAGAIKIAVLSLPELIEFSPDARDPVAELILRNVAPGLAVRGLPDEFVPGLAALISSEDLGKKIIFKLDQSAVNGSGHALNSDDIIASMAHLQHTGDFPEIFSSVRIIPRQSFPAASDSGFVDEIVIQRLVPNADIPHVSQLPLPDAELARVFGTRLGGGTLLSGYGHYSVAQRSADKIILRAKTHPENQAAFTRVELRRFSSLAAAYSALRAGETDILLEPAAETVSNAEKDPTLQIIRLAASMFDQSQIIARRHLKFEPGFAGVFKSSKISSAY